VITSNAKSTVLLSGKAKIVAVAVIFLVGISYFAWTAFNEARVEYMSVNEAVQIDAAFNDARSIGILGKLVPGSYIKSPDGVTANFRLKDENGSLELPVVYAGEVGQVFFNDHSEIILNGTMGSDGVLEAHLLTVRCPSKYLTEQERMELEGGAAPPPYQPDYFDSQPDA
jgi:cytochrome c-type biogenesis protein CcmE